MRVKKMKKFILVFLILMSVFAFYVHAVENDITDELIKGVGDYLFKTVPNPIVGSVGGEWTVLGLARSDLELPDRYFEKYYKTVEKYIKERNGILHERKYTEYSRVVIALTAIGKDPQNIAGYNLLVPLADYKKNIRQGINGAIWTLIALDSGNYEIPHNTSAEIRATREMYINYILERQTSDGGWTLYGDSADADVTGMALLALSRYQSIGKVKKATEKSLLCMSKKQNASGGFLSGEAENSESCSQMLAALSSLGISVNDERFVKNGKTILDALLSFYIKGKGFEHTHGGGVNQMATEQCFYALVALKRASEGKSGLFCMGGEISDCKYLLFSEKRDPDIRILPIIHKGKTFEDIKNDENKTKTEALAARGIINGKTETTFYPENTMTRAELAAVITRGLGLTMLENDIFEDVSEDDWFYPYVSTAYRYGIINGISKNLFDPNGTVTREEAAVMLTRVAKLCGHDTDITENEVKESLTCFSDYSEASDWSRKSLAFCFLNGIVEDDDSEISPKEYVTRSEIAGMLYNTLAVSALLWE